MAESPIFPRLIGNRGRGTRWWRQILHRKWKYGRFAHAQWKIRNTTLIYGKIAEIPASYRKSGSRNTMVTSDFRPEVEIRPFRACAMKNTQYNAYLWPNRRNSPVLKEIGVEEHNGDVRFYTGSGNGRFAHAQWKIRNITLIYGQIAEIPASYRQSGSRKTMVTSDFKPEVEI